MRLSFLWYLHEKMNVSGTCCHHFTVYVDQTIILYTLNFTQRYMSVSSQSYWKKIIRELVNLDSLLSIKDNLCTKKITGEMASLINSTKCLYHATKTPPDNWKRNTSKIMRQILLKDIERKENYKSIFLVNIDAKNLKHRHHILSAENMILKGYLSG